MKSDIYFDTNSAVNLKPNIYWIPVLLLVCGQSSVSADVCHCKPALSRSQDIPFSINI